MKRISASSLSTALQLPSQFISTVQKSPNLSEANPQPKETQLSNHMKTEKPAHLRFPHSLFAECFPTSFQTFRQNKTYRKLQYHSLDKKEIDKQTKTDQERKTMSLKDSFLSFGKQKQWNETGLITKAKVINQCAIADVFETEDNSKCNVYYETKNTGRSSLMISTRNTVNERLQKYQSSLNSKLFLSQDFKTAHILSPMQPINNNEFQKTKSETKNISDHHEKNAKKRRLSTDDSIRLKENAETDQSQVTNSPFQIASILCESIPVNHQNLDQSNPFQFDHMKDSLIDKLNLFKKQQSFIQSKRKTFIRSNKKILQDSPRFCTFEPNSCNQAQKNHENEQEFTNFEKVNSKQTVQGKFIRNKFKTLKECGKTIVSRYNKSSEQKSILQESNIVFQASKMCAAPYDQNLRIPTFSDSQVVFDNEIKQNFDNDKPYNSFIREVQSSQDHGLQMSNPSGNSVNKKINRAFLRSKKSSSEKQIRCKDNDEMEIRFDLDTFIQYGAL